MNNLKTSETRRLAKLVFYLKAFVYTGRREAHIQGLVAESELAALPHPG